MTCNILAIKALTDKKLISKAAETERIVEIEVKAPVPHVDKGRPSLNLALVLDRSGSMAGEKIEYVKRAACYMLDQMNERDQVTLVVYDDTVELIARSMNVSNGNRFELKRLVSSIRSGNMTFLSGGWFLGCKEIAASAQEGTINRTMLLTDGLANVGEVDPEILAAHAFEIYKDSISTSTFGVGEGFNEHLLEGMANRGGGNFYYIATPSQIPEIFLKELKEMVGITARKVEIKLALPPQVKYQVLGGWPSEYKDGYLHIYLGDMLSGKTQSIYIKLIFPSDEKGGTLSFGAKVFGQGMNKEVLEGQTMVEFEYRDQKDVDDAPFDQGLMQRFSLVELADTSTEALKHERAGRREEGSRLLRENLLRTQPFVSPQAHATFQKQADDINHGLSELERKRTHWDSYNLKRQKDQGQEPKEDKK